MPASSGARRDRPSSGAPSRQAASSHSADRRRAGTGGLLVAARRPGVARADHAGAVDLLQPGREQRTRERLAGVVDLGLGGQRGALEERPRRDGVAQRADLLGRPVADDQVGGAGGDGVERPLEGIDLHRHAGRDPRQPAQLDGLLEAGVIGAQERGPGAGQRVQHVGARAAVAHRDAPARHAPGEQLHGALGRQHPGDRRAVGHGGLDRQEPGLEGAGHGGVGELAALLHARPVRGAGGERATEGDAHAVTAAMGSGAPVRASPSSSAIARTCARSPGSRKSSSARNSG